MLTKIASAAIVGLEAKLVTIEVDIQSQGLPHFIIVGLPDKSVDESKERVKSAIKNSGFDFPNKKITVNMAPADISKEGARYDLPIALGILAASGQIPVTLENKIFYGELSLDGSIKPTTGSVLISILGRELNYIDIYSPKDNAKEAALIDGCTVRACEKLSDIVMHFSENFPLTIQQHSINLVKTDVQSLNDMSDVQGQHQVKRALEISAAGSHNIILIGSPGAGKTMLARTFPTILPEITTDEAIELTKLYSISGNLNDASPIISSRPFRHPHHTGSVASIIGGGTNPKPGEISLSHRGVLFMDEFLEFPKIVLESLRQPLEDGEITVSRTAATVTFPAKFILLAACNPCPCGYAYSTDRGKQCTCSASSLTRYKKKLSGPILDRIDLQVKVRAVPVNELAGDYQSENSSSIKQRVQNARNIQYDRLKNTTMRSNAEMTSNDVKKYCMLQNDAHELLKQAVQRMHLSARSYNRTIKVARTIADLSSEEYITKLHIAESLQYRFNDMI
ncbi:MAG: YifB family Mg chelatase-like AAA ATPase [bacterium]|nr:YifB family Mg chelatase-like AAA ATPase [bacterium]